MAAVAGVSATAGPDASSSAKRAGRAAAPDLTAYIVPTSGVRRAWPDWQTYEALLPRPSHSLGGKFSEAHLTTLPDVRSYLRASAWERTLTPAAQLARDAKLAAPRASVQPSADDGGVRELRVRRALLAVAAKAESIPRQAASGPLGATADSAVASPPGRGSPAPGSRRVTTRRVPPRPSTWRPPEPVEPPLPTLRATVAIARRLARNTGGSGDRGAGSKYSETPSHVLRARAQVFDLPDFVAAERAILTAGRTFTWGGRFRMQLPGYADRDRLIAEGDSIASF